MIPLSAREIASIVGGRLIDLEPDRVITGKVEFDSRKVEAGDLFLAVPGERVDGHDYAPAAVERGAVAAIATRPVGTPAIVVAEPIAALTALATAVAGRLTARVIEVTGSSGKTSTKDLIAQVLATAGPTVAPPESFNNELGFPYTVLLAGPDTSYLVLEASARGIGHIRQLTEIARPSVAAVLNVGSAHLGEFGSAEAIAQAKGELVEALPADGVAVLNADDPRVLAMAVRTRARTLTFGVAADAEVRAERVRLDRAGRAGFELVAGTARAPVSLRVRGEHQVGNALATAGVALSCGLPLATVAAALSQATARSRWRMEVTDHPSGVSLINDAYNANPESMASALRALAVLAEDRRSVAVLGEMAELGVQAGQAHRDVGALAARLGVQRLIAVGAPARPIVDGALGLAGWDGAADWVEDNDAAVGRLRELLRPGDVVLVKGSRSARLELVAAAVLNQLDSGQLDSAGIARTMKTILIAALFGLLSSILCTPLAVKYFRRHGFGQEIRDDGPQSHLVKRGTPTMGGVAIMGATIFGYIAAHLIGSLRHASGPTASGLLLLFLMLGSGGVGFLDDFIKLRHRRSLGLRARAKFLGQLVVALVFGAGAMMFRNPAGLTPASKHISYVRDISQLSVGVVGFLLLAYLIVTATTNAVNLTDGLDGLVAGSAAMVMGAYTLLTFIQFRGVCEGRHHLNGCYVVRDPQDLALVAAAAMGACFGFLWWNAKPAQIFMGDTGSMALGGLMAGLAILSRTELLLVVLGGLFAVVTLSSVIQTGWFKYTRIRTGTGKRVFRMAPFHHHFELGGWDEDTTIVRFWIVAGMAVAFGMGLFYAEFISHG